MKCFSVTGYVVVVSCGVHEFAVTNNTSMFIDASVYWKVLITTSPRPKLSATVIA